MPSTPPARPADRYGPQRRTPGKPALAAIAALALAFVGWVVWAGLRAAQPEAGAEVTGFEVRSASAIDVRVAPSPGTTGRVACTVRALDRTREVVGVAEVTLGPDLPDADERWVTVRTRARAVTATMGSCATTG